MRAVFADRHKEESFTLNGYNVIHLLDADQLEQVCSAVRELGFGIDHKKKLRVSTVDDSLEKKNEIFAKLFPLAQPAADKLLDRYKLIRIGIFDKLPGGPPTSFHCHPTLVDESKHRSISMWLPLVATTVEMGTLHVVGGSHKFAASFRAYNDYFLAYKRVAARYMKMYGTPLPLGEGRAVAFDDRLIHWTPRNRSSAIRTAVKFDFIPREAELTIYYRTGTNELSSYTIDEKSFRQAALTMEKSDSLQPTGTMACQPITKLGNRQFESIMRNMNPDRMSPKRHFFRRLFGQQAQS